MPEQPGRSTGNRGHAHDSNAGQRQPGRVVILGHPRRVEDVESTGAAEAEPSIGQAEVGVEIELFTLQAMLTVIGLHGARIRIETDETGVAAQPQLATVIGYDTVNGVAGQALAAGYCLEANGSWVGRCADYSRKSRAVGADPDAIV